MKRDLFVFAGQSNMVGASVYPPKMALSLQNSYEYKHKARRLGATRGQFVLAGYPVGEFSYTDLPTAYSAETVNVLGESLLCDYDRNTYFCPSMSNLDSEQDHTVVPFVTFSEATAPYGATLAPFLAEEWEKLGGACAYAHMAKGGVSIKHFLTEEMSAEYVRRITAFNQTNGTCYSTASPLDRAMPGAAEYFQSKCKDFFADAEEFFANDTLSSRCLFWLQGESDISRSSIEYEMMLDVFWDALKKIGFTHFCCIRVDYFGDDRIERIMRAQESFASHHEDAYLMTRAASFFTHPEQNESDWFVVPPDAEYRNCRDSEFGFPNHHINEKGFSLIAKRSAKNLYRILVEGCEPLLEEENIRTLLQNNTNISQEGKCII